MGAAGPPGVTERLRQPNEEAAPGAELRRADADAGAVADLIVLVEQVDDVEPRRQAASRPA